MIVQADYNYSRKPLEINHNKVYIRSNFKEIIDSEGNKCLEYEERQLTILEYLKEAFPESLITRDKAIAELMILLEAYQKQSDEAIAELSVLIGGILSNV